MSKVKSEKVCSNKPPILPLIANGSSISDMTVIRCEQIEFVIRFVSVICVLNDRKVTMRILSMQKKIKI